MFPNKNKYLKKWNVREDEDEAIKRFVNNYDIFIANIPKNMEEIMQKLLDQYEYISSAKAIKYIKKIYNKLGKIIKNENINIVVLPIIDEFKSNSLGEINSSNELLSQLKLIDSNNKNESLFLENSYNKLQFIEENDIIAFVDDYSGTGRTFIEVLKSIKEKIAKKKIVFFVTSIMKEAKKNIANFAEQNNIDIKIFSIKEYIKAFDKFEDSDKRRNEFVNMCKLINIKEEILGYGDSESLISFYRNTPNNTIAIFRDFYIGNENIALFERKTKNRYLDKIKKDKKSRSKMNYERKRK